MRPARSAVPMSMPDKIYEARITLRWTSTDGDQSAAREIARDMKGTILREFSAFLRSRRDSMALTETRCRHRNTTTWESIDLK